MEEGQNLVIGQTWDDSQCTEMTELGEVFPWGLVCYPQDLGEMPAVSRMGWRGARKKPAGV